MSGITKYWFLEDFNILQVLGKPSLMYLVNNLEMDNYNKGATLNLINEGKRTIYFLKKGTVKIVNPISDTVKYVVSPGNVFGESALYQKDIVDNEIAYALEDCIICAIDSDDLEALLEKNKSLKIGFIRLSGLKIKKLEKRLDNLLNTDSKTRIREFITNYIEEFAIANEAGKLIAKNLLSHRDIANLTNTSRQTVSNVLSLMRKEGLIFYDAKTISKQTHSIRNLTYQILDETD